MLPEYHELLPAKPRSRRRQPNTQQIHIRRDAQRAAVVAPAAVGRGFARVEAAERRAVGRENPDAARGYLKALSDAVDWLYDPANRDEAIAILARATKLDPPIATQTYDYYVKDLQPFSRRLAIPDEIVTSTVTTLIELGDVKPNATTMKYVDLSYLPR